MAHDLSGPQFPNQKFGWVLEDDGTWSLYSPDGTLVIASRNNRAQVSDPTSDFEIANRKYVLANGGAVAVTDGSTTVSPATSVDFTSGATVTDGGGGVAQVAVNGGSQPGAMFVIEQQIAYTAIADIGGGQFCGPAIAVPAGARLYGIASVVDTLFDDTGLSGADASVACADSGGSQAFEVAAFDLTIAANPWTGSTGSSGFFGRAQTDALQYKGSGTSPNILSAPLSVPTNQPESFPIEFTTAGNLRLSISFGAWNGDGSQGIVRLSYYVCAAPATSF